MWVITIMCPAGKAGTVFRHQRDPIWISSSVVSNWTWCGSHYHSRSDVTENRAVWHFDLSSIEIYRVSDVTHHNMTIESIVLQHLRYECQTHRLTTRDSVEGRKTEPLLSIKKRKDQVHGCGSDYLFFPWSFSTDSCSHASLVGR